MIEIQISEGVAQPQVERLDGPRVRLTVDASQEFAESLKSCQEQLLAAIEWAMLSLYSENAAPGRVFVRNPESHTMSVMFDPCASFGLEAIIRPQDFERLEDFSG